MPDIFVPEDTTGITSYYIEALNRGLVQKFSANMAEYYRKVLGQDKSVEALERILPRDNTLLSSFVDYAAANGLPARWYYINRSRDLLLNQIKAVIARDMVGYEGFIKILNRKDATLEKALYQLKNGKSPIDLSLKKTDAKK